MSSLLLRQNNEAIRIFFLKTKLLFFCKIDQNLSYYEEVYVDNIHFFDSTQGVYRELLLRE